MHERLRARDSKQNIKRVIATEICNLTVLVPNENVGDIVVEIELTDLNT